MNINLDCTIRLCGQVQIFGDQVCYNLDTLAHPNRRLPFILGFVTVNPCFITTDAAVHVVGVSYVEAVYSFLIDLSN